MVNTYRASHGVVNTGKRMSLTSPNSKDDLERSLNVLVKRAYRNGVEVGNGGYELIHEEKNIPDWDLTIIELE